MLREMARVNTLLLGLSHCDDDTRFFRPNERRLLQRRNKKKSISHQQRRDCVLFPSIPLSFLKDLKNAAGVSVNDIMMTAVSEAIHQYCNEVEGEENVSANTQCRAFLPVSFPRDPNEFEDTTTALRNNFCLMSVDMAIGQDSVFCRLSQIHAQMSKLKHTPLFVQLWTQSAVMECWPVALARRSAYDVVSRHSMVFTQVPGPLKPCYLAGKPMRSVQFFVAGPQVSFFTNVSGEITSHKS